MPSPFIEATWLRGKVLSIPPGMRSVISAEFSVTMNPVAGGPSVNSKV